MRTLSGTKKVAAKPNFEAADIAFIVQMDTLNADKDGFKILTFTAGNPKTLIGFFNIRSEAENSVLEELEVNIDDGVQELLDGKLGTLVQIIDIKGEKKTDKHLVILTD